MISAFDIAKKKIPKLHGLIPIPSSLSASQAFNELRIRKDISFLENSAIDVLRVADAGLIKSGTSNLQAALAGLPFAMVYKANFVTEVIVRMLFKRRVFSIVNIIKEGSIREIIQGEVREDILAQEIEDLLLNNEYREKIKQNLLLVEKELTVSGNSLTAKRVAELF